MTVAPTGANAGTPGTWVPANATPPVDVAGMTGIVANPSTPWVNSQRMVLRNGTSLATWSGINWVGGPAPALRSDKRKG